MALVKERARQWSQWTDLARNQSYGKVAAGWIVDQLEYNTMSLCRLGVDDNLTDSENEEGEQQGSPSNHEGTEQQSDGKSTSQESDSEPCCSSSIVDNTGNSEDTVPQSASSDPKLETVISTNDKELPPCDQDNQDHEVRRGIDHTSNPINLPLSDSADRSICI